MLYSRRTEKETQQSTRQLQSSENQDVVVVQVELVVAEAQPVFSLVAVKAVESGDLIEPGRSFL